MVTGMQDTRIGSDTIDVRHGSGKIDVRHDSATPTRPLLKWAGGKRQLLPALRRHYPATFDRYVEPFLGSGAVFFDLFSAGRLDGRVARLADSNPDLIGCYRAVRDEPDAVIGALAALEREHRARGTDCYYEVRDERFNPARLRGSDSSSVNAPDLAAMFIYLNRTGFNGLFRLNRHGGFNVPVGRYTNPKICDPHHVRAVARALGTPGVTLECMPFDEALSDASAGDFVYCDPPYAPLSKTASFAHYTAGGFGEADHGRLLAALVAGARRGATVLVSNSSAPVIVKAYTAPPVRDAGLVVHRVPARRAINSRAGLRGPIDELIVTNAPVTAVRHVPLRMLRGRLRARDPHQLAATRASEGQT
jgi:DNA adenine methylase